MKLPFLAAALLVVTAPAAPVAIRHLEPMHWWIGMRHPELQLMVHGDGIGETVPELDYPGVTLTGLQHTDNRNYLFVDLRIDPGTVPGTFPIRFRRGAEVVATADYRLEARQPGSADRRGFDARDAIYLITPDRFANGDPTNDSAPGLREKADRANPSGRHGGDLRGMREHLDYIAGLGFTMIWPTPLTENDQERFSYHGYSNTDLYHVDARFGTNDEFREFVAAARARGLGVIQDIVVNHIGTGHWWMRDLPASDWLNYQDHPEMTNNEHATVMDPHAAPDDRRRFQDGWFVREMPDLNQRNPLLARYLIQNSLWWIEYAGLSGLREDTYSYADPQFLAAWSNAVLEEYPHLNIVGEEMDGVPAHVAYWQKGVVNRDGYASGLPTVMDFPVVGILPAVFTGEEKWDSGLHRLYQTIASDYVYADPMRVMIFPDNHDQSRIFTLLHEDLPSLRSVLLFTATTRGVLQVYYGTEILTTSPYQRDDGRLRADMPGGWAGDPVNAFTGAGLTAAQRETQEFVRRLLTWRKASHAIAAGRLEHYVPRDGRYVYFRYDDHETVMVVINKNPADAPLDLARFRDRIGNRTVGRDVITGQEYSLAAQLPLKGKQSVVLELR